MKKRKQIELNIFPRKFNFTGKPPIQREVYYLLAERIEEAPVSTEYCLLSGVISESIEMRIFV